MTLSRGFSEDTRLTVSMFETSMEAGTTKLYAQKICARLASWGAGFRGFSERIIWRINVAVFSWVFCVNCETRVTYNF
jgi:hypothetical protein